MNRFARFNPGVLLVVVLTACATSAQLSQTPAPPAATVASIPPANTPTPVPPTKVPFKNILVYDPPEMYDVNVETVQYPTINGTSDTLPMDIFYPPDRKPGELLPAVVLVNGFPNNPFSNKRTFPPFQSWGRFIAASGLIAVAYDTRNENDLEAVINYIQQKGADLGIDSSKLGFWSTSSSGGLASNFAFQEGREYMKFAVFYYAWIMTPDNFERDFEDASCKQIGCLGAQLSDVKQLRTDLPLFVVRPGIDHPHNLAIVDHFAELAKEAGVPLTLIRFDQGKHQFDWSEITPPGENRDKAIEIIKQTLKFMK